jgi:hypothetical protein
MSRHRINRWGAWLRVCSVALRLAQLEAEKQTCLNRIRADWKLLRREVLVMIATLEAESPPEESARALSR